jgi:hypothetical protein
MGVYEKQEINEIANMAFVSGRMNRELRPKEPISYLPEILQKRGETALTLQAIPLDDALYTVDRYRSFLETRRKMWVDEVTAFLEKTNK